ncbi:hypothetical protein JKP88DRAFT_315392 [Tribonema minus]|uniref:Uncharacterized protein n=1 Tax=Tribonema minus TaxID=303371 RepID=A0A835YZE3_9STRA|nr:hypothetical protein JKP88DRAFT_315392 [Tribonema minus]
MEHAAASCDTAGIETMRAALGGRLSCREAFGSSCCLQMQALCDGNFENVAALCAALARNEGWSDASLQLYRQSAAGAGTHCTDGSWTARQVPKLICSRERRHGDRRLPRGFRWDLVWWYWCSRRHGECCGSRARQVVRDDCDSVYSNERLLKRNASNGIHVLQPALSLHVSAPAYLQLLADFECIMKTVKTLLPPEYLGRYATGKGRCRLNGDSSKRSPRSAKPLSYALLCPRCRHRSFEFAVQFQPGPVRKSLQLQQYPALAVTAVQQERRNTTPKVEQQKRKHSTASTATASAAHSKTETPSSAALPQHQQR